MRYDNNNSDAESNTPSASAQQAATSSVTAASIMNRIAKPAAPVVEESAPWEDEPAKTVVAESKPKMQTPDDILAAIRRRQGK